MDDDLSRVCLCEVFDLAEGGVLLLFENGKGRLYESKDEMLALLKEVEEEALKGPKSIAADLPQGRAFADQVPELIGKLAILLSIDAAQLDRSEVSLENVDKALRRLRPQQLLTPEVFAPLTAYVGEVIRGATGGSWEMRRGPDPGQSWELWIVGPAGRSCAPFLILQRAARISEIRQSAWLGGGDISNLGAQAYRTYRDDLPNRSEVGICTTKSDPTGLTRFSSPSSSKARRPQHGAEVHAWRIYRGDDPPQKKPD